MARKRIVDRHKLTIALAKNEMIQRDLSKILGITEASISQKMKCQRSFNESEIYILYKRFGTYIFLK